MASIFHHVVKRFSTIENVLLNFFFRRFPSESEFPAIFNLPLVEGIASKSQNLNDILKDSVLWAVPKKRRTIEKRRCRRFGWPNGFYKMLLPKSNILSCTKCGSYHEANLLCPNCYNRVKKETEEMQEAIQAQLGISPVESEVVVLHTGEKQKNAEFYEGKQIVEIKKEKAKIFSNNLLQRSTQSSTSAKEVMKSNKNLY